MNSGSRRLDKPAGVLARMSSLDGLRAASVALVLLRHLSGTRGFGRVDLLVGDYGHLGVTVFFVISGFLITTLLMSEQESNGQISIKLFYARRSLRIFPASYTYVIVASALSALGMIHLRQSDIWHSFAYTANYLPSRSWYIGHLWSLSVEEQFYLLWPVAFVLAGYKKARWVGLWVILVAIVARGANRVLLIDTPYHDLEMFPMVADSLAMGCMLALLRDRLESCKPYQLLLRPAGSLTVLGVILILNRFMAYSVINIFGTTLISFGIAVLIHRSVHSPQDWAGRILNWKPVVFIGGLSYSLYLWQQLFLNRESGAWFNTYPQNLIGAVTLAMASYYAIERPMLRLRKRLHVRPAERIISFMPSPEATKSLSS
ncbi:MAG TPA: acyltransferase [Terracidiphilus sp.]